MAVHSFSLARFGDVMGGECRNHCQRTQPKQNKTNKRKREKGGKAYKIYKRTTWYNGTAYEAYTKFKTKKESENTSQPHSMFKAFNFQHQITMVIE